MRKQKRENFYAKKLRESADYRKWWDKLLESEVYEQASFFLELDIEKERSANDGAAHWKALSKDEFKRRYHEGEINKNLITLPDSFKTIAIIKRLGITSFFDPSPKAVGKISHWTAGCGFRGDGDHPSPNVNASASDKEMRDGLKAATDFFQRALKVERPEDGNPSTASMKRSRSNPLNREVENLEKRIKRMRGKESMRKYLITLLDHGKDEDLLQLKNGKLEILLPDGIIYDFAFWENTDLLNEAIRKKLLRKTDTAIEFLL